MPKPFPRLLKAQSLIKTYGNREKVRCLRYELNYKSSRRMVVRSIHLSYRDIGGNYNSRVHGYELSIWV